MISETVTQCHDSNDVPCAHAMNPGSVRENVVSHSKKRKKSRFFGF